MQIDISSHYRPPQCDAQTLATLTRRVLKEALEAGGASDTSETSVLYINDAEMRELNAKYRAIDKPTDVLSFAMNEGELPDGENDLLGDIVISLETAQRQADHAGHTLRREIAILLIHGALHLLGFDHVAENRTKEKAIAREMRSLERTILENLQIKIVI